MGGLVNAALQYMNSGVFSASESIGLKRGPEQGRAPLKTRC